MGGRSSTARKVHYHRLTKEEYGLMCTLFKSVCQMDPEKGCTYSDFVEFCDKLHPLLAEFVIQFYFGENVTWVIRSIREFISLFAYLVRGSIEDQTKVMEIVLLNIVHEKKPKKKFFITGAAAHPHKFLSLQINYQVDPEMFSFKLGNYLEGLICSYIKMEYNCSNKEFRSWRRVKAKFSAADIEKLAYVLEDDCTHPESSKDIENWVSGWRTIKRLHIVVYSYLFGLQDTIHYESLKSVFPLCQSKHRHNVCILDLCSILYLNSYLPPTCRFRWKLLFSSRVHGLNFRHLVEKIVHEGPSLVVIQDTNNYMFGGFASSSWRPSRSFYGNCWAFLFQIQPNLKIYECTGYDENYQIMRVRVRGHGHGGFGMGAGKMGLCAWWIDGESTEALRGSCTDTCSTFKNTPILSSQPNFVVDCIEIWSVDEPVKEVTKRPKRHVHRSQRDLKAESSNIRDAGKSLLAHQGLKKYTDGYRMTRASDKWKPLDDEKEEKVDSDLDDYYSSEDSEDEDFGKLKDRDKDIDQEDSEGGSIDWETLEGDESDDSDESAPRRGSRKRSTLKHGK